MITNCPKLWRSLLWKRKSEGFPPAPIGETPTLLRPAVPCLNFADLRELAREFVPEMTGGQITLLGGRGCPDARDGKVAKIASRYI